MNLTDFNLKSEPWKIFDFVVSYWGAAQNVDQPLYWIERPIGQKEYSFAFALGKTAAKKTFEQLLEDCPELEPWLAAQGWSRSTVFEEVQQFVLDQIKTDQWNAERLTDEKVIRSRPRRPPPLHWSYNEFFRKQYWKNVLSKEEFGRSSDTWAKTMKSFLTQESNSESAKWVQSQLRKLIERQPNWEIQTGQSFRVWARNNKSWEKILDRMSIMYGVEQDAIPVVLWSIENNWFYGTKKWCQEKDVSLTFSPKTEDLLDSWIDEEKLFTSGTLWHWGVRSSSLEWVKEAIRFDKTVLLATDSNGRTALHWACAFEREDIIGFLLSKGLSLDTEDLNGKIPSELVPYHNDKLFNQLEDYRIVKKTSLEKPIKNQQ